MYVPLWEIKLKTYLIVYVHCVLFDPVHTKIASLFVNFDKGVVHKWRHGLTGVEGVTDFVTTVLRP